MFTMPVMSLREVDPHRHAEVSSLALLEGGGLMFCFMLKICISTMLIYLCIYIYTCVLWKSIRCQLILVGCWF
jgi:hypothetical protein